MENVTQLVTVFGGAGFVGTQVVQALAQKGYRILVAVRRPDLAGPSLSHVKAPTLLIVGGDDIAVIGMNEDAFSQLRCEKRLEIVPGASHLFEEPGTLDQVASLAGRTFWLNPEPRLYWNYGDSVIAAYEPFCEAHECWTTKQLEDFVKALTRPANV